MKEVAREAQFGIIYDRLKNGLITDFDNDDLEVAYELYKEIVSSDIKSGYVTIPILRLSRDPEQALENVVERVDPLDTDQMSDEKEENAEKRL